VVLDVNVRRGRNSKCNLYSVDPSCGSGSSFVIPVSCRRIGALYDRDMGLFEPRCCGCSPPAIVGVVLPGVDHGEEILGGLGSYVKIDAILAVHRICRGVSSSMIACVPPYNS
jgi:hypothetical protein